jgi:site-specific recombinase XerD
MALTRRMPEPGGMHRAEVIGLTVGSIDLDSDVAVVIGKGRGPRAGSPTGHRTGQALTRYLRALPAGLGAAPAGNVHRRSVARPDGALTDDGPGQVLEGPASSRPSPASTHPLRHAAADRWLGEYGGNERPAKAGIGDKLLAGLSDHGHGTGSRTK